MKLDRRIGWGASLAAFAVLGWLCTATVENGSRGVVERFGAAKRELAPGIHLRLPWPIESIRRAEVDRSLQMPIGYRLVDALMEIDPTPREKQWLTADTNIVELKAEFHFILNEGIVSHSMSMRIGQSSIPSG